MIMWRKRFRGEYAFVDYRAPDNKQFKICMQGNIAGIKQGSRALLRDRFYLYSQFCARLAARRVGWSRLFLSGRGRTTTDGAATSCFARALLPGSGSVRVQQIQAEVQLFDMVGGYAGRKMEHRKALI